MKINLPITTKTLLFSGLLALGVLISAAGLSRSGRGLLPGLAMALETALAGVGSTLQPAVAGCSTAPTLTGNVTVVDPVTNIVNLTPLTATNLPSGATLTWHTGTPATAANQMSSITAVYPGTAYAAFYDAAANCYGPTTAFLIPINSGVADNDKDGVPDATDLDDDNDGILDVNEQFACDKNSGAWTVSGNTATTSTFLC